MSSFSEAVQPLYQRLALLSSPESKELVSECNEDGVRAFILFHALNEALSSATEGKVGLLSAMDVSGRLYDWISMVISLLLPGISNGKESAAKEVNESMKSAQVLFLHHEEFLHLVGALRVLLVKARDDPEALVAFLDILLFKLILLIEVFDRWQREDEAETFAMQMQKVSCFCIMDLCFESLDAIETRHMGFLAEGVVARILRTVLVKPPGLDDVQAECWPDLLSTFTTSKWNLVGSMARFSVKSIELCEVVDLDALFGDCALALETARYKSVLGILKCMGTLLSVSYQPSLIQGNAAAASTGASAGNVKSSRIDSVKTIQALKTAKDLINDMESTPAWHYLYVEAAIDCFVQLEVLSDRKLQSAVISDLIDWLIDQVGQHRRNIVTHLGSRLHQILNTTDASKLELSRSVRMALCDQISKLLAFGPARPGSLQMDGSIRSSNPPNSEELHCRNLTILNAQQLTNNQRAAVVDAMERGSDYLVRAQMNSMLLQMDPRDVNDHAFAMSLLDNLLDDLC